MELSEVIWGILGIIIIFLIPRLLLIIVVILPIIQLIFIRRYDFTRYLKLLLIILVILTLFSTIGQIYLLKQNLPEGRGLLYIYLLLIICLISYISKKIYIKRKNNTIDGTTKY